jgi:hypothetical protein
MPLSEYERGYNDAANALATALTELRRRHRIRNGECCDIISLIERFKELREVHVQTKSGNT